MSAMSELSTAWSKRVRRLFRLPPRTHSRFVAPLCKQRTIDIQLNARFFCFFKKVFSNTNPLVKYSAMMALSGSQSHVAENLRTIVSKQNVNQYLFSTDPNCLHMDSFTDPQLSEEDTAVVGAITELIQCRDGFSGIVLNELEIIQLLHFLCVN